MKMWIMKAMKLILRTFRLLKSWSSRKNNKKTNSVVHKSMFQSTDLQQQKSHKIGSRKRFFISLNQNRISQGHQKKKSFTIHKDKEKHPSSSKWNQEMNYQALQFHCTTFQRENYKIPNVIWKSKHLLRIRVCRENIQLNSWRLYPNKNLVTRNKCNLREAYKIILHNLAFHRIIAPIKTWTIKVR